jgi:hypothetical protein
LEGGSGYVCSGGSDEMEEEMIKLITATAVIVLMGTNAMADRLNQAGSPIPGNPQTGSETEQGTQQVQSPPDIGPSYLQAACIQDYVQYCGEEGGGASIAISCLRQFWINLSYTCRNAIDQYNQNNQDQQIQEGLPLPGQLDN